LVDPVTTMQLRPLLITHRNTNSGEHVGLFYADPREKNLCLQKLLLKIIYEKGKFIKVFGILKYNPRMIRKQLKCTVEHVETKGQNEVT
jgi:hypothetical protein